MVSRFLGIAVGDQEARVDETPEQREGTARQIVEQGAARLVPER
jgi:hypothetical protein